MRGPDDQPYLYDGNNAFLLGDPIGGGNPNAKDLPRNAANPRRALIGDPRNDENVIVSQLQGVFLRFHNRVVDFLGDRADFATAQRFVRWHYQWVVLNDFLPTILGWDCNRLLNQTSNTSLAVPTKFATSSCGFVRSDLPFSMDNLVLEKPRYYALVLFQNYGSNGSVLFTCFWNSVGSRLL